MSHSTVTQELLTKKFPVYIDKEQKKQAIQETEKLFRSLNSVPKRKKRWQDLLYLPLLTKPKTDYTVSPPITVDKTGLVHPYWKGLFTQAMKEVAELEQVSVTDFGAVGDGQTDCTEAFREAIGKGRRRVFVPAGVYRTRGLKLPSYTALIGAGTVETVLLLADEAPKKERLITNQDYWKGNHHIEIAHLTLNWNVERLSKEERTSAGGTASSGITLAHVQFAWVKQVKIINPGLHGVDVTSIRYNYFGDGRRSVLGSRFVWVDEVEVTGFGDDGITTHHSDDLLITNSYLHHPSGRAHKKGFSNSNGIEVDDGSQHVVLANNRTAFCFGGIEIKAHETSSAASDTQIIGHYSYHDNRSYNFRHIGHHQLEDTQSQSAYGIRATYLVADSPQYTNLYLKSTPRALVVSAYQRVVIHSFFAQAGQDEQDSIAISLQYRANQVKLREIKLEGYTRSKKALRVSETTRDISIVEENE
ncbi:glycoside hydrolase family 55 protein [Desemzia sp. RIT804]|uniref:glycosyl hydrolase family 28-related protein n=1 Tax=Desemzia sp. RIT 804 TaxID=2810209 RepID=UPI00194E6DBB|nr:glycosyl hydrolase family 28-related protein [Desemzia sp. RIT 804]MBM6614516.1 glycoside hydrolase family 55 protein [Desemzia sp. RIT 804]